MNNELYKNGEGYADPTAAATLTQPEPGDVWEYNGGECLIIKNHGNFSTILWLMNNDAPGSIKVLEGDDTAPAAYTNPQYLTYGKHCLMGQYLETLSVSAFTAVTKAIEDTLGIQLPRTEPQRAQEPSPAPAPQADDPVNHPAHYTSGGIECIDAIRASMTPVEFQGFLKGNALKYLWRYRLKGRPAQDLAKAEWYLAKLAAAETEVQHEG